MKRTILIIAILAFSSLAFAQKKTIQFDAENLPTQLLAYLNSATSDDARKKDNAKVIKLFTDVYNATDDPTRERMTAVFSAAQKQKIRQIPDLTDFITLVWMLYTSEPDHHNFLPWIACVQFIQENKTAKVFNEFTGFTRQLITDRTLQKSRSAVWQAQPGSPYTLALQGRDIIVTFATPTDIFYNSDKDHGTIYGTKGTFNYLDSKWVGEGGRITWDRTGIPTTACWADLNRYQANTKLSKLTADSVQLTYTKYFTTPIMGSIEDVLDYPMDPEKYNYPKFRSYQNDFVLNDIIPGADYRGTFMLNGAKFVTSSTEHPASLVFSRDGKPFIVVTSTKFTIANGKALSERAAVKIYIDGDSIYNNGISMRYAVSDKRLTLVNNGKRNYYSPYTNTYHNLDMYCEQMVWNPEKDMIEMSMLGETGSSSFATFESSNYYSLKKYREIQGIDEQSPVVKVFKFSKANGGLDEFSISEFASAIKMDVSQAKLMIHNLAKGGLVSFDENLGIVYLKNRLNDYMRAYSKSRDYDYDAISLESNTTRRNAELDLSTNDLLIHGVDSFFVSDSQHVEIKPTRGDLVIRRDREMHFSGLIYAGRFGMRVKDATFYYDRFSLDLPDVESLVFSVERFDDPNKLHAVNNTLSHLVGSLDIDKPDNHNGLTKNKEYPIFRSQTESYVYFDNKNLYNGAYIRDRFYYKIEPFTLNSLTDFKTDSLRFSGTLTSAGIFPDIHQPLTVQSDYSLGFVMDTPKEGLPTYGGKGQFVHRLNLSNKGLRAMGDLKYLTSFSHSNQMVFLPDSMLATTDTFIVREEGGFPEIHNSRTHQSWYPYLDSMQVCQAPKAPEFQMYHNESTLAGCLILQPQGATANGTITLREGTFESDRFQLKTMEMLADVSSFTLRSDVYKATAYRATNMKSQVDYTTHHATLTSNKALQRTELPVMKYVADIDKVDWDINHKQLTILNSKSEASGGLEGLSIRERLRHTQQPGVRFVSTDPKCDSLQYYALASDYSYNLGQLSSRGVFLINVADAAIAPAGDTVHINPGGEMSQLQHSQLLASRSNGFHSIYDADLIIKGRNSYTGKGYIDYVDEDEGVQKIYLDQIAPNPSGTTIAQGTIQSQDQFTLSSAFGFAGIVRIEADKEPYYFDGGVRLIHQCTSVEQLGLLAFKGYLDPKNIQITVPELPIDWHGDRLTASILFDKNNLAPHIAFLTKERAADNELVTATGLISFDKDTRTYTLASAEKLNNFNEVVSPYLLYNTTQCQLEAEGSLFFGLKNGLSRFFSYGTAQLDKNPENFTSNTLFGVTFPMDAGIINAIAQQFADDLRLSPTNPDNEVLRHAMIYYQGEERGNDNYSIYVSSGAYDRIPKEFESTFFLQGIKWQYSPALGYHYSGMASLALVGKKQLHVDIRVKAQITRRGNASYLNLYLSAANDHWYYFSYEANTQQLIVYSSVGEIEDLIKSLSAEKREITDHDLGTFRYRVGTSKSEVPNFLLRIDGTNTATDDDENE